jgi:GNAT superfamily N-acetyltransferase
MDQRPTPPLLITAPAPADETEWRRLWLGYCQFYEAGVPESTTALIWQRLLTPGSQTRALIVRRPGEPAGAPLLGFAHYVLHDNTWDPRPVCYLEDLFTNPAGRGRGVGRALINRLLDLSTESGWGRLYWHTRGSNQVARRLYDSIAGGADDFVRYVIRID